MMATVRHVTSSSGLRKFQADGFLFDRVYQVLLMYDFLNSVMVRYWWSVWCVACSKAEWNLIMLRAMSHCLKF